MRLFSAGLGLFLPLLRHSRFRVFLGFFGKKPVILHGAFNLKYLHIKNKALASRNPVLQRRHITVSGI